MYTGVILAHIQTVGIQGLHRVHQQDKDRAFRMLVAGPAEGGFASKIWYWPGSDSTMEDVDVSNVCQHASRCACKRGMSTQLRRTLITVILLMTAIRIGAIRVRLVILLVVVTIKVPGILHDSSCEPWLTCSVPHLPCWDLSIDAKGSRV